MTPTTEPMPRPLGVLVAVHAMAAVVSVLLVAALVSGDGDVRRPDWLEPTGRAVAAALVLLAAYGTAAWLLYRRRRAGLALAALLAAAGLIAGVVGLRGPLLVNVAILALVALPSVRAAAH